MGSPSYEIQNPSVPLFLFLFSYIQVFWFPHRLGSEDHTKPWFCPKLGIIIILLYLAFFIGAGPRTLQGLGSVYPLFFFRYLTSCRARGCPRQLLFPGVGRSLRTPLQDGPGPRLYWAHQLGDISLVFSHAALFDVPVLEVRLSQTPLISWSQLTLEVEPETFCL